MQNFLIFKTIPKLIKQGKFLPVDSEVNSLFSGTDTEELFQKNLKTKPENWKYRSAPVRYTYNKDCYRTRNFNEIDWNKSIVIFGCSNVFGVGVDDSETISTYLESITNRPVINMGVGGSSITYSFHNSIILKANYPMPLAVVHLWTDYSRTVYYYRNSLKSYGSWNMEENNYMDLWSKSEHHGMTHALFASLSSKQLWENTRYYEASFFSDTAKLLGCDRLKTVDRARDDSHYGCKTLKLTAERIAEKLNL